MHCITKRLSLSGWALTGLHAGLFSANEQLQGEATQFGAGHKADQGANSPELRYRCGRSFKCGKRLQILGCIGKAKQRFLGGPSQPTGREVTILTFFATSTLALANHRYYQLSDYRGSNF